MDSTFLEKFKSEIQDFFNLPMEEKKKLWQQPDDIEGFGQVFVVSEEQKLDWSDMFFLTMQPVQLRKPHLFPNLPLPFRETLDTYSAEVKSIAKILLAKVAVALKIKPEEMEELFDDEVNEVDGLQIKKNGKWVSVKPLPNAFVVNIGDILEIITNGTYRSIEHRGVVNSEKERLSVASFHSMGFGKVIGPMRSLVERHEAAIFKSVTTEEYFNGLFSRALDGKAYLDVMRV
ncbi:protein SRG1 isoform X2 [Capsella rubella]|uniref:protein SRG1 isoform X2 n=1 Tax=Capsella rubella TaxID=81985 RepID=UPI000CD55386|nr:protein SRG1 isoform X2 [Capsella rubella]